MPLRVDNTEITQLYVDGQECKILYVNGTPCFGKKYTITGSVYYVSVSVMRKSSPYGHAPTGAITNRDPIYEGDCLEISVTANSGYMYPKLYANIGDGGGESLRPTTYSFTVCGNVSFRCTAESVILFSGTQTFTSSGSFTVPRLIDSMNILVSGIAIFKEEISSYSGTKTNYVNVYVSDRELPTYVENNSAYIKLTRNGNTINFEFNSYDGINKGIGTRITPTQLNITRVMVKT